MRQIGGGEECEADWMRGGMWGRLEEGRNVRQIGGGEECEADWRRAGM